MRYQDVPDGLGDVVARLAPCRTVYAEIRPVRGNEYTEYYKDLHEMSVKITMRFLEDLLPTDVLSWKGKQYLINSIINPEQQDYILEVMCTEKHETERPEVE